MTEKHVRSWLGDLLAEHLGLSADEAVMAARACSQNDGQFSVLVATTTAAVAQATPLLPGGKTWWSAEGSRVRVRFLDGEPDYAEEVVGEVLAQPAADVWDTNWPPSKVAWAALRDGTQAGDEYILGDGMGRRGTFRVVMDDGALAAECVETSWSLEELWDRSLAIAEELFAQDLPGN